MAVQGTLICQDIQQFVAPRSSQTGCSISILGLSAGVCVGTGNSSVHSLAIQVNISNLGGNIVEITVDGETRIFTVQTEGTNTFVFNNIVCGTSSKVNEVIVENPSERTCTATGFYRTPVTGNNDWVFVQSIPQGLEIKDCINVVSFTPTSSSPFNLEIVFSTGIPNLTLSWTTQGVNRYRYSSGSTTFYCVVDVTYADFTTTSFNITLYSTSSAQVGINNLSLNSDIIDNALSC